MVVYRNLSRGEGVEVRILLLIQKRSRLAAISRVRSIEKRVSVFLDDRVVIGSSSFRALRWRYWGLLLGLLWSWNIVESLFDLNCLNRFSRWSCIRWRYKLLTACSWVLRHHLRTTKWSSFVAFLALLNWLIRLLLNSRKLILDSFCLVSDKLCLQLQ